MTPRVVHQSQQCLPDPRWVAANPAFLKIKEGHQSCCTQAWLKQLDQSSNLRSQVDLLDLKTQTADIGKSYNPQVLYQPCEAFNLRQQTVELHGVWLEDTFGKTLNSAAQNRDGSAQLMGDRGIPKGLLLGKSLQPFGHDVEIIHQQGGFPQGVVIGGRSDAQVSLCQLTQAISDGVQRRQDAARKPNGGTEGERQRDRCGHSHPRPFRS